MKEKEKGDNAESNERRRERRPTLVGEGKRESGIMPTLDR